MSVTQIAEIPYGHHPEGFTVSASPTMTYPVKLKLPPEASRITPLGMTREEAQALLEALDDALNFDPTPYVQVKVGGTAYTYRDPSGSLKVDDLVEVPFGYRNAAKLGKVFALGRGSYTGPTKDVTSRLLAEPLAA